MAKITISGVSLKVKNGMTTFNGVWIESARYDSKSLCTLALQRELDSDVQFINKV